VTGGGERSRVEVVSGSAEVRTPRGGMVVRAGETVTASSSGIERSGAGSGGAAWTRGMLEFDSARLASVVELANGYSETKIQLSGAIGELRVTGAFRAGDPEGLAKALSAAFRLSLARSAKGNFVLKAPANKNGG
jgi:ferric-dicitrate binding protein FerR (iron transport regulator)